MERLRREIFFGALVVALLVALAGGQQVPLQIVKPPKEGRPRGVEIGLGVHAPFFGLEEDPEMGFMANGLKREIIPLQSADLKKAVKGAGGGWWGQVVGRDDVESLKKCVEVNVWDLDAFVEHLLPAIEQFENLQVLTIESKREFGRKDLEALAALKKAPRLRQLRIRRIAAGTGEIVGLLEKLPDLQVVSLHGEFDEKSFAGIGKLNKLRGIQISSENMLKRRTLLEPAEIAKLDKLECLVLDEIDDPLLNQIVTLEKLQSLAVEGTKLTEKAITRIGELKNLTSLCVPVNATELAFLLELKKLKYLDFSGTAGLKREQLQALAQLKQVKYLNLNMRPIKEEALSELAKMQSLEVLDIEWTHISGEGLPALAGCKTLRWITLDFDAAYSAGGTKLQDLNEVVRYSYEFGFSHK